MSDSAKQRVSGDESNANGLANTRREFLGATAAAGVGGSVWGSGEAAAEGGSESVDDPAIDPAEASAISEQDGVFNITDYGAVGDGKTDNTQAIYDTIEAAAEVDGTVLVPEGEFVTDWIILRHEHSGLTIEGLGYGSVIKPLQAIDPKAAWTWGIYNDDTGQIPIDPTNFTHGIQLNDGFSPPEPFPGSLGNEDEIDFQYREASPIKNITVRNLRLNGMRDQIPKDDGPETWEMDTYDNGSPYTPVDAPTGRGINFSADKGYGNTIEHVWTHDWMYEGVRSAMSGVNISNLITWNNGFHGLGGGGNTDEMAQNVSNVISVQNGQYGIDASGGVWHVSNFELRNNAFGMKLAGPDLTSIVNGKIVGSVHNGFHMTNETKRAWLTNVESRANGGAGFAFYQEGRINIGQITSLDNNQRTEPTQFSENGPAKNWEILVPEPNEPEKDTAVIADSVRIGSSNAAGIKITDEFRVNDLQVENCEEAGVIHDGGEFVMRGGEIRNNGGTSIRLESGTRSLIAGARLEDDVGVDVQSGVGPVTLQNLDLRESSTPIQIADGVDPTIDDLDGFPTAATGSASFSGGGGQKTFTIEHGLAVAPHYVNAVADASSDAPSVAGVKNVTDTSFDIEFAKAAPSGFLDEENVTVHWEATAY